MSFDDDEVSVATVHWQYINRGGAERVAEEIAEVFNSPLYYGFGQESELPDKPTEFIELFDDNILTSIIRQSQKLRDMYRPFAWQHQAELHNYDILIQSGYEPGWYTPSPEQIVVRYIHTIPRAQYNHFPEKGNDIKIKIYSMIWRSLYHPMVANADLYLANSELTARNLNQYWDIDAEVVHPPIDIDSYYTSTEDDDYYFAMSRLVGKKNISEIVEAFQHLPEYNLIIAGKGPKKKKLESIAPDNVEIRGYVDEEEKRSLLSRATAFIYSGRKTDFGIAPAEALASGTPVIGVEDGFTKYQIKEYENGLLYPPGVMNLVSTIKEFESIDEFDPNTVRKSAEKYDVEVFITKMNKAVSEAWENSIVANNSYI